MSQATAVHSTAALAPPVVRATGRRDLLSPSRRGILAAAASALAMGAVVASAAHGATPATPGPGIAAAPASTMPAGADAELIRLYNRLVEIVAAEAVIFETVDEADQEKALQPFTQEYRLIEDRVYDLGNPTTPEGVLACARAAVATAPKDADGTIYCGNHGLAEALAFTVAEMTAARAVNLPTPDNRDAGDDADLLDAARALTAADDLVQRIQAEGASLPAGITPESCDQERRLSAANELWWEAVERIEGTPARTLAGLRAKADALRLVLLRCNCGIDPTVEDIADLDMDNRMAWSIARDLLARSAAE